MSAALPLDPARIRANFPAFAEPTLAGQAFFENAGGSYMAQQVIDKFERYFRTTKVQPYGRYPASQAAGEAMDLSFRRMGEALGVDAGWIHFGPSTSANTYMLGNAFAGWLQPGDVVIVTDQDHEANSGAWRKLAAHGMEIREWQVDRQTGRLSIDRLDDLLDERVKVIAFTHCSNIVGEINDVAAITAKARAVGAITVVDGVSYAPHGLPDVKALGADIYLFSAYKVYGPHQGIMAVRPELMQALPNQGHFFNAGKPRNHLSPAGPDHAQIAVASGMIDYFDAVAAIAAPSNEAPARRASKAMHAQEVELSRPLLAWIASRNSVRLIGPGEPEIRAPTISLLLNEPGAGAAARLASHGIMAGGGGFYASRLMQSLGIREDHGVLRLSFLHYTSPEEIAQLIRALDVELA